MVIIMKKIKIISGIVTVAVMGLIFFFSSQTAAESSNTSSGILDKLIYMISPFVSMDGAMAIREVCHVIVRKSAHFILYFILGVSAANTSFWCFKTRTIYLVLMSFVFCVLYAISDEVHQYFVPGRAMMATDVLIDRIGAILGCLLFFAVKRYIVRRRENGI